MQQYKYARDGMIPVSNGDWYRVEDIDEPEVDLDRKADILMEKQKAFETISEIMPG